MSKYAKIDGLTDLVVELRDAGVRWVGTGEGIVEQVQAKFPAYTTNSAIPLRRLYQEAKATDKVKPTAKRVQAWRREGKGWGAIAALTGASTAELKKLAGEWAEGRV